MNVPIALAKILAAAGVHIDLLGHEESCCGHFAGASATKYLFQCQAKQNIETLQRITKVKKIVTACPHCYHTLKFRVTHSSEGSSMVDSPYRADPANSSTKVASSSAASSIRSVALTRTRATSPTTTRSMRRRGRSWRPSRGESGGDVPLPLSQRVLWRRRGRYVDGEEPDQRREPACAIKDAVATQADIAR